MGVMIGYIMVGMFGGWLLMGTAGWLFSFQSNWATAAAVIFGGIIGLVLCSLCTISARASDLEDEILRNYYRSQEKIPDKLEPKN